MLDPASPSQANALLRAHGLRPRKRWGQNFLCDRNAVERIVRAGALTPDTAVLEIGAGLGALTQALAASASSVTAVEIDRLLEPILREVLAGRSNVRLIFEDFLRLGLPELLDEAFGDRPGVVMANIPYYITTPILERLLGAKERTQRIVLLVQQEFAARMAAEPGTPEYGAMTVFVQYHARVERVGVVPPQLFVPRPAVTSAIVALSPVSPGTVPVRDEGAYFRLVRASFGQRRKTLPNALAGGDIGMDRGAAEALVRAAGIDPARRGETLTLEEFGHLAAAAVVR